MLKRVSIALTGLAFVVAACSEPTAPSPIVVGKPTPSGSQSADLELAQEQILRIDLGGEPTTLDPSLATDASSIAVLHALTRGLVYFDKELNIVPGLAESYEISPDGTTITFRLKEATYSNGDRIVARDFAYSWKRLVDPRTAAGYSYVMAEVVGGQELLALAGADALPPDAEIERLLDGFGVSAPDDRTFVVKLASPAAYFLSVAALWVTVPIQESWITSSDATEAGNYVSSGPFMLAAWDHNNNIVLTPNSLWTGTQPTLTEIRMTMSGEPLQAQAAYEAGELDMVATPPEDLTRVVNDPVLGPEVLDNSRLQIAFYNFNVTKGPTQNLDFRIALTQAIDKRAFIDATFGGTGEIANSFIMPGIPGYQPDLNPYPYDLASAKVHMDKALAELGASNVADLGGLTIGFNSGAGHESRVAFLAEAWRQAFGIEFEQVGAEGSVFFEQVGAGAYHISRNAWSADYPHAHNQLAGLFTCGGGINDSHYCSQEFDALLADATDEVDPTAQLAIYNQAQDLLIRDVPILPLRFTSTRYTVRPHVSGLIVTPADSQLPGDLFYETIRILKH